MTPAQDGDPETGRPASRPVVSPDQQPRRGADGGQGSDADRPSRTERDDFQATSDPALQEADRSDVKLLDYRELYHLWERQQWLTQDLDFSQDRIDWHERIPEEERFQRMYGLSSFFIGEQKVADELGPIMRAAPTEEQRIFLCTQIADEARHVRFFDRFFSEVGVLEGADELAAAARGARRAPQRRLRRALRRAAQGAGRPARQEPDDRDALVEAITLYHMVIEGMLALTGQHFIIDYNEREGTLPGFVEGFSNVARDEHRHIAFGVRFLPDQVQRGRAQPRGDPGDARGGDPDRRQGDRPALGRPRTTTSYSGSAARRPTRSRRSAWPGASR